MKTELETKDRTLTLFRFPKRKSEPLQAWNAADEYLISEISSNKRSKVLILNDSFGALCCFFAEQQLVHCGDSFISQQAIQKNLFENNLPQENVTFISPMDKLPSDINLVILRLPKSQALLEFQLIKIAQQLSSGVKIIAAAMAKDIHNSTLKLFEKYIGTTKTSLAKKKARLIFSELEQSPAENPYPKTWQLEFGDKIFHVENQANVFSLNGLDLGARFMLENLPSGNFVKIIDLGCGNGALGLVAASRYAEPQISFVDESFMAIDSARNNWHHNFPERKDDADFLVTDCLNGVADNHADLILCNPPFHQQQTITDHIALQMFADSARVLTKDGQLLVIGNRHLGYHIKLKKWFRKIEQVAANSKFVIFLASQ